MGELYTMDPIDGCLHGVYKGHNWNQYMLDQLDTDQQNESCTSERALTDSDSTDPPVVHANWLGTKHRHLSDQDLEKLQPYFAWVPMFTVRKTLENTNQYAKAVMNYPMICHLASRFKLLNHFRLEEIVSMDDMAFMTVVGLHRWSCAQGFYGLKSHMINVYGMESKAGAHDAYRDLIRNKGIPSGLHPDLAEEQNSKQFAEMDREYNVRDSFLEAGYPNQNPVEAMAIKWLKHAAERLMNHTGTPDFVAVYALMYLALVNNWITDPGLGWKTPFQKRHGITPDISALLAFHFYELIYYLDVEAPFPTSKVKWHSPPKRRTNQTIYWHVLHIFGSRL
jgi:hypothetical protein